MPTPHLSVLKNEFLEVFREMKVRRFIDGTLGAAGHAEALLSAHPEIESFYGVDQDRDALAIARKQLAKWGDKVELLHGNFVEMDQLIDEPVEGILLDIGVSSMQLDRPERGFSFMRDGPLDMRMDQSQGITAEEVVNTWPEKELGRIFRDYGEEKFWRRAAHACVEAREEGGIRTTGELARIIEKSIPRKKEIHPATLIFQALRICVNGEIEKIAGVVPKAIDLLAPGGKLCIISFHSLEDRVVKNAFRDAASDKVSTSGIRGVFLEKEPTVKVLTRKPIVPTEEEAAENPRSRSAKMRVVEKR